MKTLILILLFAGAVQAQILPKPLARDTISTVLIEQGQPIDSSTVNRGKKHYYIGRYEEKVGALYIWIGHTEQPVQIGYNFTTEERATRHSRKEAIERLVAKLYVMAEKEAAKDVYKPKLRDLSGMVLDSVKIDIEMRRLKKIVP